MYYEKQIDIPKIIYWRSRKIKRNSITYKFPNINYKKILNL